MDLVIIRALECISLLQTIPQNSAVCSQLEKLSNEIITKQDCSLGVSYNEILITIKERLTDYITPQENLFVENIITIIGQFKVFSVQAIPEFYNIPRLLSYAQHTSLFAYDDFTTAHLLLSLANKISERCGLPYYVQGNPNFEELQCNTQLVDNRKDYLWFSSSELEALLPYGKFSEKALIDYVITDIEHVINNDNREHIVENRPILMYGDKYLVLSPSALFACAWREILRVYKTHLSDREIHDVVFNTTVTYAHIVFQQLTYRPLDISITDSNHIIEVYEIYFHIYMVVVYVQNKDDEITTSDATYYNPTREDNAIPDNLKNIVGQVKKHDPLASIFVVAIDACVQGGLAFAFDTIPVIPFIDIDSLSTLLLKPNLDRLWLYYYAIDRSVCKIAPFSSERDVISFYIRNNFTFYQSEDSPMKDVLLYTQPGIYISEKYQLLSRQNRHIIKYNSIGHIIQRDEDAPAFLPLYSSSIEQGLYVSEHLIASIFISKLPDIEQNDILYRSIAKSINIWLFAIEQRTQRTILKQDVCLSIVIGDTNKFGILRDIECRKIEQGCYVLYVSNIIFNDGYEIDKVEERILCVLLGCIDKDGFLLNPDYNAIIREMFTECSGRYLLLLNNFNPMADLERCGQESYTINPRWNDVVLQKLADDIGGEIKEYSLDESKMLVPRIIKYLNRRIIDILETFNQAELLQSLYALYDGLQFWHHTMFSRFNKIQSVYQYLGLVDEEQEQFINNNVESNLITRCLIEYTTIKCKNFRNKDIDAIKIDEAYALMRLLIEIGRLNDYYKLSSVTNTISVVGSGRFSFPLDLYDNMNAYTKYINTDRLWNHDTYKSLSSIVSDIQRNDVLTQYNNAFAAEFGLSVEWYDNITQAIAQYIGEGPEHVICRTLTALKAYIRDKTSCSSDILTVYFNNFAISPLYREPNTICGFNDHDLFPCRYRRKLSIISRPYSLFHEDGEEYIIFSYRGFMQSYMQLESNILKCKYDAMSPAMKTFQGTLNELRGKRFEQSVANLFRNTNHLIVLQNVAIAPRKQLPNDINIGDIDVLLIDNQTQSIICIEAKNYNKCKTPYEVVELTRKIEKDLKKIMRRDKWCVENLQKFSNLARVNTSNYKIKTVVVTHHKNAAEYINPHLSNIPFVWIRELIDNPMDIFKEC